jgi:D-lactate dehydrogenase (cytochrome)
VSAAALGEIAGVTLTTDPAVRALVGGDLGATPGATPAAVARPRDVEALAALVRRASATGTPLVPRGGGLSYTGGYVGDTAHAVTVDLRGLDAIESIAPGEQVAVVQAGCTWAALERALEPHGLCARFRGPLSGLVSTIGGGVSQNAAFWGSGRYGTAADAVLGLEVVTGGGARLRTGALGAGDAPAFFRAYGPDPTGLFVGDAGAYGVKARVALALRPRPVADSLSFTFDAPAALLAAMADIARADLVAQQCAFDPLLVALRTRRQSLVEDFRALAAVLRGSRSLTRGLRDAASMAIAGRGFLESAGWLLHCMAEARGPASLAEDLAAIRAIARGHGGREVENTVPQVMTATPFPPPNGIVGPDGERWLPVHGLVPLSRGADAYRAVLDALEAREGETTRHGVACGTLFATVGAQALLLEPMFFWPDALDALHRDTLEPRVLARLPVREAQPQARSAVLGLRRAVVDALAPFGGAHLQLGRFYPWLERRDGAFGALARALKRELDPAGILNPGAIGLGGSA